jgi:hypothetical protein
VGFAVLSNHPQCIAKQIIETGKVTNAKTMNHNQGYTDRVKEKIGGE